MNDFNIVSFLSSLLLFVRSLMMFFLGVEYPSILLPSIGVFYVRSLPLPMDKDHLRSWWLSQPLSRQLLLSLPLHNYPGAPRSCVTLLKPFSSSTMARTIVLNATIVTTANTHGKSLPLTSSIFILQPLPEPPTFPLSFPRPLPIVPVATTTISVFAVAALLVSPPPLDPQHCISQPHTRDIHQFHQTPLPPPKDPWFSSDFQCQPLQSLSLHQN